MPDSKKEQILKALENTLLAIIIGDKPSSSSVYVYENTISYLNRQYLAITPEDIENKPKPWIVLNNNGESFEPYPSEKFDNNLMISIACFVQATESSPNLDSLMNSLQKDIIIAILSDRRLGGLATSMTPRTILTVDELIYPFGGFVINLDITYGFMGINL